MFKSKLKKPIRIFMMNFKYLYTLNKLIDKPIIAYYYAFNDGTSLMFC